MINTAPNDSEQRASKHNTGKIKGYINIIKSSLAPLLLKLSTPLIVEIKNPHRQFLNCISLDPLDSVIFVYSTYYLSPGVAPHSQAFCEGGGRPGNEASTLLYLALISKAISIVLMGGR